MNDLDKLQEIEHKTKKDMFGKQKIKLYKIKHIIFDFGGVMIEKTFVLKNLFNLIEAREPKQEPGTKKKPLILLNNMPIVIVEKFNDCIRFNDCMEYFGCENLYRACISYSCKECSEYSTWYYCGTLPGYIEEDLQNAKLCEAAIS